MTRYVSLSAGAVLAVLLTVLAASAVPVSAANTSIQASADYVVGDDHSSASELSNGSLTNADVERSGEAGFVGHDTYRSSAVARWALDSGSGTTVYDHVGGHDGSFVGSPTWVSGAQGQALEFDGDDAVNAGPSPNVTGAITVTAWVNQSYPQGPGTNIISSGYDGSNTGYQIRYINTTGDSTADLQVGSYDGTGHRASVNGNDLPSGRFHVAGVYRPSTGQWSVYINGEDVTDVRTGNGTGAISDSEDLTIGATSSTGTIQGEFNGVIDDPRIYSEDLSPGLIQRLASHPGAKLTPQAVDRWGVDAGSGSVAYGDAGHDGTITNAAWSDGRVGSALTFNGDGYVDMGDPSDLEGFGDSVTVSTWVKIDDTSKTQTIVGKDRIYSLDLYNGHFRFLTGQGSWGSDAVVSSVSPVEGEWYHVRAVYNGSEKRLYVNGELNGSTSASGNLGTNSLPFAIGAYYTGASWDSHLNGSVDEVRVYDTAVSESLSRYPAAGVSETSSYESSAMQVSSVEEAWTDVELQNATATITWRTTDGTVLNQTTVSSSGNYSATWSGTYQADKEVVVDFEATHPNHTARLHDDGILFTPHAPQANNLSPADGAELTDESVEFTADISDEDLSTAQGDSVEARLFVDGEQVGSETVTSNQTISVNHEIIEGGTHEYYWELEDEYGQSTTTDTFTLNTPSELDIYNITSGQNETPKLVDNASIEVRMYQNGTIYERTAENGTVDLSDISPAEPFVAVVDAPGYYSRRIFVESLYDRQRVYLLPDNRTSVDVIFNLQEYTGKYPQDDTILQVQRAINGSWETALGDYFGANAQFPATLEYNTRYRLRLVNIESGDSRLLGSFTPITSSTQNVVVAPSGDVNVTSLDAVWELMETKSMPATSVPFNASLQTGDADIQSWNVTVNYVANNTTQQLYHANSSTESGQTVGTELNLSERAGGEVHVVASYEVEDGTVQTFTRSYRVSEYFANENALIPSLTQFVSLVPEGNQPAFTTFLAMMMTVLVTSGVMYTTPMSTEVAGMLAWLLIAGFAIIGWVSYEMVFVAGVGAGSLVYLRRPI